MNKLTKETILDTIDFEETANLAWEQSPTWTTAEITNAMVAAYNRAIDDVVEFSVGKYGHLGVDRGSVLKLKI